MRLVPCEQSNIVSPALRVRTDLAPSMEYVQEGESAQTLFVVLKWIPVSLSDERRSERAASFPSSGSRSCASRDSRPRVPTPAGNACPW